MNLERYQHLLQYIKYQVYPPNQTEKEQRKIQGQALKFLIKDNILYKKKKLHPENPLRVVKQ